MLGLLQLVCIPFPLGLNQRVLLNSPPPYVPEWQNCDMRTKRQADLAQLLRQLPLGQHERRALATQQGMELWKKGFTLLY